jgi:hypothetical protein
MLGHTTGCLWLALAAWLFLDAATATGIGIDVSLTPLAPWMLATTALGALLLVAGRWWPVLLASALAGVG